MGYRAQKKYSQSNTDILEAVQLLTEISAESGIDTNRMLYKLDGMEEDIKGWCYLAVDIEGINKKQDRLKGRLERVENKQDGLIRKLDKLENSIMLSLVTILITVFAVVLILA